MITWSKEVFAKNLKKYMREREKTQKEMAEIIGVSAPTMNDWVQGRKYPRIDKIEMMADYFGILKSDLIEDKELNDSETVAYQQFKILKNNFKDVKFTAKEMEEIKNYIEFVITRRGKDIQQTKGDM